MHLLTRVAVKLAQSFLGTQVKLKFSHTKEKPVLCFLGQGEWLGNTLQGQAHAFAASRAAKYNQWGITFLNPQQELPLLHRALPTSMAMETVATTSSSYSLSG